MPQFSIIIPVYNAGTDLDRCLLSLVNQSFEDFEILLIDDGSTDNSLQIAKEWSKKDTRIRVFHQKNLGASSARNVGLEHAVGQYIQLVDSDDTIEPNCLSYLYSLIRKYNDPDVVEFRLNYIGPSGVRNQQGTILKEGIYDREYIEQEFLPVMLQIEENSKISYNIFNVLRIAKRSLLIQNNIRFNPKIKRWEDWLFALEIYSAASEMVVSSQSLYNYYGHIGGGLGGKYNPDTIHYVVTTYKLLDQLMGSRYNMNSAYAIQQKLHQIERCIWEYYVNESPQNCKKLIYIVLEEPYVKKLFLETCCTAGICVARASIASNNLSHAADLIYNYVRKTDRKSRIRSLLSRIYHKYIKGDRLK